MPRALITGITGQDGLYLSELLLAKGYEVYGLIRGQNNPKRELVRGDRARGRAAHRRPHRPVQPDAGASRLRSPTRSTTSARSRSWRTRGRTPGSPPSHRQRACSTCSRRCGCTPATDPAKVRFYQASSLGDVRQGAGGAAAREDPAVAALALRRGQGLRALHDHQLPRVLRHARVLRHPVQPRVPAPRTGVRHPQGVDGRRRDRARAAGRRSRWATSTPSATGASPATTSRRMWRMLQQPRGRRLRAVAPARRTRSATCSTSPSPGSASTTGPAHVAAGPALHAAGRGRPAHRRRRARPASGSAGSPRWPSTSSSR